jgi:hypothetical protein
VPFRIGESCRKPSFGAQSPSADQQFGATSRQARRHAREDQGAGAATHRRPLTRRRRRRERELGDLGQHSAGAGRDAELLAHVGERDVCEREMVDRREVAGALGTPPKAFGEEIGSAVAG